MRLPLLTEKSRKKIFRNALPLALTALLAACGKPDSAVVPTPSSSTCSNVSYVGAVATSPTSIKYYLETTALVGAQNKITITKGVAPFQISSTGFVGLGKTASISALTDGNGVAIDNMVLNETDAVPDTVDPSCSTYIFYLQPIGPFTPAATYTEYVTVRDSVSNTFDLEVKITSSIPKTPKTGVFY